MSAQPTALLPPSVDLARVRQELRTANLALFHAEQALDPVRPAARLPLPFPGIRSYLELGTLSESPELLDLADDVRDAAYVVERALGRVEKLEFAARRATPLPAESEVN